MKLISWNCNMAFRKKAAVILQHKPDILIVPECEEPGKLKFPAGVPTPKDSQWFGMNPHKGIGIFSYSKYRFSVFRNYNPAYRYIIPLEVTNGRSAFNLFAIWANNADDKEGRYVEQIWKAIRYYEKQLSGKPTLLAGDFNSNTIWDRPRRTGNHSHVVSFLEERGIYSTYHQYHNIQQGKEPHSTLFLHRNTAKGYHIDYCFASKDLLQKLKGVEIGWFEDWVGYSDHVPVMISFRQV